MIIESENYISQALSASNHGLLPIQRPNSMNSYGLILNTIGMRPFWTCFINQILKPISNVLLPAQIWRNYRDQGQDIQEMKTQNDKSDDKKHDKPSESGSKIVETVKNKEMNDCDDGNDNDNSDDCEQEWDFKSHHTFMIRYKQGEDIALETHIDASDVTLNVCLGKPGFEGAKVYFHNISGSIKDKEANKSYQSPHPENQCQYCTYKLFHKIGWGVLHIGKYVHGAETLTNGERCNVVIWAREYES